MWLISVKNASERKYTNSKKLCSFLWPMYIDDKMHDSFASDTAARFKRTRSALLHGSIQVPISLATGEAWASPNLEGAIALDSDHALSQPGHQ